MKPVTSKSATRVADDFAFHAWVDESMHDAVPGVSEPIYVLAAAIADPRECEPVRDRLRELVPRGRHRLHWRDEDAPLKRKVASAIAEADFCGVVVVGMEADLSKQERARRKCMEQMLFRLEEMGVSQVWLEARTPTLNRRDQKLVDALRGRKVISNAIRLDIAYPSTEPMLWIPDALAGATGMAWKGSEAEFRVTMGGVIEEIELSVRG